MDWWLYCNRTRRNWYSLINHVRRGTRRRMDRTSIWTSNELHQVGEIFNENDFIQRICFSSVYRRIFGTLKWKTFGMILMLCVIVGSVTLVAVNYQQISKKITENIDETDGKNWIGEWRENTFEYDRWILLDFHLNTMIDDDSSNRLFNSRQARSLKKVREFDFSLLI